MSKLRPRPKLRGVELLRWLANRRDLRELDGRLLRDVGLTHEDVRRGVPFKAAAPQQIGLIRLGTLEVRDWQIKLYAPVAEAAGLRPEDLAAARRAFSAVLAELSREPVAGFAVLSGIHETHLPAGSLALTVCQWDGLELRRCAVFPGRLRRGGLRLIALSRVFFGWQVVGAAFVLAMFAWDYQLLRPGDLP